MQRETRRERAQKEQRYSSFVTMDHRPCFISARLYRFDKRLWGHVGVARASSHHLASFTSRCIENVRQAGGLVTGATAHRTNLSMDLIPTWHDDVWAEIPGSMGVHESRGLRMNTLADVPGWTPAPILTPSWDGLRATESDEKTLVLFENRSNSGVMVDVFWIDFSGKEISMGALEPGKSRFQPSYVGHSWILRESSSGKPVIMFVVQNALGAVTVRGTSDANYTNLL